MTKVDFMSKSYDLFKAVLEQEARSIERVISLIQPNQVDELLSLYNFIRTNGGELVTCGVGKSGIVAKKISATFASLGMPSSFLHPVEALHGDLGRLKSTDVILLISKSGTTEEILKLIPFLPMPKNQIIGLLGNVESPISAKCSLVFDCSVDREACLNNQAPTNSTTVALAVGDAMAVVYEDYIGLSKEGFAVNHPGGLLGKSLSLRVEDLMLHKSECPTVDIEDEMQEVILAMTAKPVGICFVTENNKLKGIIVEGDIRRTLSKNQKGLKTKAKEMMNEHPLSLNPKMLAIEAMTIMEKRERPVLVAPVIENQEFIGVIRIHDLLKEGFRSK